MHVLKVCVILSFSLAAKPDSVWSNSMYAHICNG